MKRFNFIMLLKIPFRLLFCSFFFIKSINCQNETFRISDWLDTFQNRTDGEVKNVEVKFLSMMEAFLEFAELAVQMNTKVEEMMNAKEAVPDEEFADFMFSTSKMKKFLKTKLAELKNDPDRMNPQKWAFLQTLPDTFSKFTTTTTDMSSRMLKASEARKRDVLKLDETSRRTTELTHRIGSISEEIGFPVGYNADALTPNDEATIKAKGKIMVKMAALLVIYFKRLLETEDKLENLGYFESDELPTDEETRKSIEIELGVMDETRKTVSSLVGEARQVMGQGNLLSYAMETVRSTTAKLQTLNQQIKERGKKSTGKLRLAAKAIEDLLKYIPNPTELPLPRLEL